MFEKRVRMCAVNRAVPWIFATAVAIAPFAAFAQSLSLGGAQPAASSEAGLVKRATAPAPKQVNLSAVPQVTAKELAAMAARPALARLATSPAQQQYAALKAAAAQLRFEIPDLKPMSGPPAGSTAAPAGAAGILTPVASASLETRCDTGANLGLAVGDTGVGVIQAGNFCISVFSRGGVLQPGYPKSPNGFFGVPATTYLLDPRALYDWANRRYIMLFGAQNPPYGSSASYFVAVSTGDDPTGTYYIYNLPTNFKPGNGGNLMDFPRLGQDRQAIYVAGNVYSGTRIPYCCIVYNYDGEEWLLLPKAAMYAGTAGFAYNVIDNPTGPDISVVKYHQPANVFSYLDNPRAEYFIASFSTETGPYGQFNCLTTSGCNGLDVWAVSNPLDTTGPGPELSNFTVPTHFNYFFPPNAAQPGTSDWIETADARISGEVTYVGGSLYAALTTNNGAGGAAVILYRIQPVLNRNDDMRCTGPFLNFCPQITGADTISENLLDYGGHNSAFLATQQPDPEGNVTTVFNYSGPNDYPSVAYISSRVSQGASAATNDFVDNGHILAAGQAFVPLPNSSACMEAPPTCYLASYSHYTAVAPAGIAWEALRPTLPSMWFAGRFAVSGGTWATAIGRNGFRSPDQP